MKNVNRYLLPLAITSAIIGSTAAKANEICSGYGPQTPRDISRVAGTNTRMFSLAPNIGQMNLCNIHMHTNAEHKGPGFSVFLGKGKHGGYQCNQSNSLTEAELKPLSEGESDFEGVKPGDTIEVHWVYSSCDVKPGKGLGSCSSDSCLNPELRVESQVFLVVNDVSALKLTDFAYMDTVRNGYHQAKALPTGTGAPVLFAGSTTGPKYTEAVCSPLQVTWNVRPQCAKVHIGSIGAWAKADAVFEEKESHGVRQLVTAPELLAPIN